MPPFFAGGVNRIALESLAEHKDRAKARVVASGVYTSTGTQGWLGGVHGEGKAVLHAEMVARLYSGNAHACPHGPRAAVGIGGLHEALSRSLAKALRAVK